MCYCSELQQEGAIDLSARIDAVLEIVDNLVSQNVKLKKQLIFTFKRKPSKPAKAKAAKAKAAKGKPATEKPATEKSTSENSATENAATENSATEISATRNSVTEISATEISATEISATEKPVDEAVVDTRISKIFSYDPRHFGISLLLSDSCEEWLQNPSSFLQFDQAPYDQSTNNPQHSAIISIRKLEEQDSHSRILRRLYCIVLSRLRRSNRNEDAETIAKALYEYYYPRQSLCEDKLKQLTPRIRNLVHAGIRYEHLAQVFGIGALFILGDDVSNSVWERWLPKEGMRFDRATKYLISKGIITHGVPFDNLGTNVIQLITERLPKNGCAFVQVTMKPPSQITNSYDGANPRINNKRPHPSSSSDRADSEAKKRRSRSSQSNQKKISEYRSAKTRPQVQDDGVATSDKDEASSYCHIGTEMRSDAADETSGVQILLKAAGHIEGKSNAASENQIRIGSTSSDHSTDCFKGDNIHHRLLEVDGNCCSQEPRPELSSGIRRDEHYNKDHQSSSPVETAGILTDTTALQPPAQQDICIPEVWPDLAPLDIGWWIYNDFTQLWPSSGQEEPQMDSAALQPPAQQDICIPESKMGALQPRAQQDMGIPEPQMGALQPPAQQDICIPEAWPDLAPLDIGWWIYNDFTKLWPSSGQEELQMDSAALQPPAQQDICIHESQMGVFQPPAQHEMGRNINSQSLLGQGNRNRFDGVAIGMV